MLPKTLSASSLKVAALCMLRWKAEYLNRTPGFSSHTAAEVGSTVHLALENYVYQCFILKEQEPTWDLLKEMYKAAFIEIFQSHDFERSEFTDGEKLAKRWFDRTDLSAIEVLSTEEKETINVNGIHKGKQVTIPFNYIIDRVDRLGPGEYRVVDYKTQRVPLLPDDLHDNLQARAYALAIQIKYPDATKIRVQFDLLRHDPVGIVVTREDNVNFWRYLCATVQDILDVDEADVKPTLNMECGYCVLAATCPALRKNVANGGIHSLTSAQLAKLKFDIEAQMKGNKTLLEKVEEKLLLEAIERDTLEWQEGDSGIQVEITAGRRRQIDASQVAGIIGPEEFAKLGSITLGVVDDLIKDPNLPQEKRDALKGLIYYKTGDPKAKVKPLAKLT